MEPVNSWEISYVISLYKPHIDLEIKKDKLFFKIGNLRAKELRRWAEEEFTHKWFTLHV